MGRKKKTPGVININELEIENKIEIDYDKLEQAILKATTAADKIKTTEEEAKKTELISRRNKKLGEKDFSHIQNRFWRHLRIMMNKGWVIIRVLFVPKELAKEFSAVDSLFKLVTALSFWIARFALYVLTAYLAVQTFVQANPVLTLYGIAAFMLAQIFRIAQIEVENLKDREYVIGVFAAVVAIVSLVVSILD